MGFLQFLQILESQKPFPLVDSSSHEQLNLHRSEPNIPQPAPRSNNTNLEQDEQENENSWGDDETTEQITENIENQTRNQNNNRASEPQVQNDK